MAKGPGPSFNWIVATVTNTGDTAREAVITIPGPGLCRVGLPAGEAVGARALQRGADGRGHARPAAGAGRERLSAEPACGRHRGHRLRDDGGGGSPVTLWQREAYDSRKDYLSFFRGALLGVSVLLAAALFALYGFRARAVFPVAGGFALSAVAFMMLEAGHLPDLLARLSIPGLDLQILRAVIEGLMAAFLLLLLGVLSELRARVARGAATLLMTLGGLAFALPIYGFADPLMAIDAGARRLRRDAHCWVSSSSSCCGAWAR